MLVHLFVQWVCTDMGPWFKVCIAVILQEVGCAFIKMSSTQLISGVSGDSEERIRDLFDLAVVTNLHNPSSAV